jgi:predicted AlkP superfamily phosphohydrolase/phosphomutase
MMVEMGPDRLHHALWRQMQPGGPLEAEARNYYATLDAHVAELIANAGEETTLIVASDHGARSMTGGVRINEWLRAHGWLEVSGGEIDWSRTRAWGEGGYHARIMLNVAGRETHGIVPRQDYEAERARLAEALGKMSGPDGVSLGNVVLRPEDAYREVRGLPPDLIVCLGDLAWRSLGTLGAGEVFTAGDDASDDGCNHDWNGIFIAAGPDFAARGPIDGMRIEDVARTILARFAIPPPTGMHGRDLAEHTP